MRQDIQHRRLSAVVSCLFTPAAATGLLIGAVLLSAATMARSQEAKAAKAPTYTVLYTFTGGADGANPGAGAAGAVLALDEEDNLFGSTSSGGDFSPACGSYGCGLVYKLDPIGRESVLHTFSDSPDGVVPASGVILDGEGNLYGATVGGGTAGIGFGTVFKIDQSGKERLLHSFSGGADGNGPYGSLIRDKEGNLYGTTFAGGNLSGCFGDGCGVVFKLDRSGKETVLHSFTDGADGAFPNAGVIRDEQGNIYGTTSSGGTFGQGVLFKLDPTGTETVLYSFSGGADGAQPGGLTMDHEGTLYGAAANGGANGNGVVFKLVQGGEFSVLYTFTGGTDGGVPYGTPLLIGSKLYGTTFFGGNLTTCGGFCGVIYQLNSEGTETVLYSFTGGADGANGTTSLVHDAEGNLYGATGYGGDLSSPAVSCGGIGCGVVFKLKLR